MRRTLLASLAGACAALAALAALTYLQPSIVLDMDVDPPRAVASGFYPVERTKDETFVWTTPLATVTLRGIDRDVEWMCSVRMRGARPADVSPGQFAIGADGATVASGTLGGAYEEIAVTVPRRPGGSSASLTISTTPPYVPASDPRQLGVMVDELRCQPSAAWAAPPSSALIAAAGLGAIFGALFAIVLGIRRSGLSEGDRPLRGPVPIRRNPQRLYRLGGLLGAVLTVGSGLAFLLTTGIAAYSRAYIDWILPVALSTAGAAGLILAVVSRRPTPLHPATGFVLAFTSAVLCLKVLALLHPSKEVVDAVFQAHRLKAVLDGNYFFTQLMPGGVRFPYAIGLYVTAAPWTTLISDHIAVLRIVVLVAEAVAGALLYLAVVRTWGDRLAAAASTVLYHAAPLSYVIIGNANLTFSFGQSIATIAVALAVLLRLDGRALLGALALLVVTALAFLSHVGVFPLLGLTLAATGVLYAARGGADLRRPAVVVLGASVLAAVFAVGTYYAHFPDVWRTLGRVSAPAQPAADDTTAAARPLAAGERAARAARIGVDAYGPWLLALIPLGLVSLRHRRADRLTLALAGCGASFLVFLALRVLAPVDAPFQRYADEFIHRIYGMTLPAVAILAGSAVAWTWRSNLAGRVAGAALALAAVAGGVHQWTTWFR